MKTYRILHRPSGLWWEGQAPSAQDACLKAGWLIGDCWVRELTPVVTDPTAESGHRGGGWRTVICLDPYID